MSRRSPRTGRARRAAARERGRRRPLPPRQARCRQAHPRRTRAIGRRFRASTSAASRASASAAC
ncbi:hypothetical protein DVW87_01495 [Sphingomonas aracearum]|uniref:Uncharacterized protein n=1 Tax=Sphingomonas aracearum TaxID=2283317 RepID=A0A369VWC9_9SPHN|nr:hypothetical protein DVW87_01495 [Sphingomonas aracearum]